MQEGFWRAALNMLIVVVSVVVISLILGFRAEDATLAATSEIAAPVYSLELPGDSSMAAVEAGSTLVAVKAARDFAARIGSAIAAPTPASICHLFDPATGRRIAGSPA